MNLDEPMQGHDGIPSDAQRLADEFSLPSIAGGNTLPVEESCLTEASEVVTFPIRFAVTECSVVDSVRCGKTPA